MGACCDSSFTYHDESVADFDLIAGCQSDLVDIGSDVHDFSRLVSAIPFDTHCVGTHYCLIH